MLTRPQRAALAAIVAAGAAGVHHNPWGKGYGVRVAHGRVVDALLERKLVEIGSHGDGLTHWCRNGHACLILVATDAGRKELEGR